MREQKLNNILGRRCTACGEFKLFSEFHNSKDGLYSKNCRCKSCCKLSYGKNKDALLESKKEYYIKNKERILADRKRYVSLNKDKVQVARAEYRQRHRSRLAEEALGYWHKNKDVLLPKKREYYQRNKDEINSQKRNYWHENRDKFKLKRSEYLEKNREVLNAKKRDYWTENRDTLLEEKRERYRLGNKSTYYANNKKRKALKLKAIPAYANLERVRDYYYTAELLNKLMPLENDKWSVDHKIPLQGKTVCGFHIETNLQVMSLRDNVSKNNKLIGGFNG